MLSILFRGLINFRVARSEGWRKYWREAWQWHSKLIFSPSQMRLTKHSHLYLTSLSIETLDKGLKIWQSNIFFLQFDCWDFLNIYFLSLNRGVLCCYYLKKFHVAWWEQSKDNQQQLELKMDPIGDSQGLFYCTNHIGKYKIGAIILAFLLTFAILANSLLVKWAFMKCL